MTESTDVTIIGAGPSGSIAAALLRQRGHRVVLLEQTYFPRFSIGESLLPQCMVFIAEAGMQEAVERAAFQRKNGAAFVHQGNNAAFDFRKKFTAGPETTYQVQRAKFDLLLSNEAARLGADLRFGHRIEKLDYLNDSPRLHIVQENEARYQITSRYVLDASGFGRVLPRLLDLDLPSDQSPRTSVFTHIEDNINSHLYDRNKILIAVHPEHDDVWYWLIPFSNGRSSIGVVARSDFFDTRRASASHLLMSAIAGCPDVHCLLHAAVFDVPVDRISGYSCNVKSLHGKGYALLGNAGEFLDPVFSSGVTIAMKSASLAAPLVDRQLRGETVNWESEYAAPLRLGVDTFRTFVNAWYDGSFQKVVFARDQQPGVRAMVSSILAGYAWDTNNPLVKQSKRRLAALAELCA